MATPLTSNAILRELNLSKSTFYYLLKNNFISISTTDSGRYVWDNETILALKSIMQEREQVETIMEQPKVKNLLKSEPLW